MDNSPAKVKQVIIYRYYVKFWLHYFALCDAIVLKYDYIYFPGVHGSSKVFSRTTAAVQSPKGFQPSNNNNKSCFQLHFDKIANQQLLQAKQRFRLLL